MRSSVLFVFILLLCIGCDDGESTVTLNEMSPAVQEFMRLRGQSSTSFEITNPNNARYNLMANALSEIQFQPHMMLADEIYYYPPWGSAVLCGTNNTTVDELGGRTTVFDRGESCEKDWGNLHITLHGKATSYERLTISESLGMTRDYNLVTSFVYENYGGEGDQSVWNKVGKTNSGGHAVKNLNDGQYTGEHWLADTLSFEFNDRIATYHGRIESTFTNKDWSVDRNDFRFTEGDNFFSGTLLTSLVWNRSCDQNVSRWSDQVRQFTLGREKIVYRHNGVDGSFVIDYGSAFCDNIIYISEGGKKAKIDLSVRLEL